MKKTLSTLTLLLAMLTASNAWATGGTLIGIGTSTNPYIISDLADWNTFAGWLNDGTTAADYVDKYYKLVADIGTTANPVTIPASEYYNNPFRGNFNGNGHTITVALTRTTIPEGDEYLQGLALFHYVGNGCNIHDLNVAGTINTCGKFAAGFIAFISKGSNGDNPKIVSISRCRSSVTITSTVTGDATSSGFVGASKKYVNLVLNNCRFDGAFVSSTATQFSGMIGWQDGAGHANTLNCLVKPGAGMNLTAPDGNHYTYCRCGGDSFGLANCYYYTAIGTEQGNAVGDMSNDDLKNALGDAWLVQDGEVVPYAISYHYTLIDHYTATDYNVPKNIIPDHGAFGYAKLVDGNKSTFWETWPIDWTPFYTNFQSESPFVVKGYVLTMSPQIQDNPKHNPIEWYLRGKNADGDWEVIDHRGEYHYEDPGEFLPTMNSAEKVYVLAGNTKSYQQFQFEIMRVQGWDNQSNMRFELAELQMFGLLNNNDMANACISGVKDIYMWDNGNPIEVNNVVTDYNGTVLTEGIDYTQTITNSMGNVVSEVTDAGSYTLTVTGTGTESQGYYGTKSIGFSVTDHPTGLSVDYSVPEGTIGHYYIDLLKNQQTIIDLNTMTPPFTAPFKVYDDGGKDHNFSKGCSEDLLVVAPEGYVIQVCGNADVGDETLLEFYDGTWGENLMAGNFNRCLGDDIGFLITTGPQLAIKYNTSTATTRWGLNLTVMVVPANTVSPILIFNDGHGAVDANVNGSPVGAATVGDLVTLTAIPNAGYLPNDFTAKDAQDNTVFVEGGWYTGNNATFAMPGSEVTIYPNFVPTTVTGTDPIELSVNIPRISNGPSDALVATIPEGVGCFKVYDSGGPDGYYSYSSDGYLLLVAPENKVIQLTAVSMHDIHPGDNLEVYDGNTTDHPLGGPYSYDDDMGILTTTGNQMLLHFICNYEYYSTYAGLNLLARVYDTTDEFAITVTPTEYGTVAVDPASGAASVSSTVTLTFTPNEGYTGYRPMDFVTNYPSVLVDGGWYSHNEMTFPMPSGPVTVTPNYTSATTAEDGLYVNMPKKNTYATSRMVDIPIGVSSFKVYDDGGKDGLFSNFCDGYMILTAPEGYRIKLTGTVECEQDSDGLEVYDGNTTDQLIGRYGYSTLDQQYNFVGEDIGTIYSSGQSLLLHFYSNNWNEFTLNYGLDLTVEPVTLPSPYLTFSGFTATAGQNGYDPSDESESWPSLVDNTTTTVWRTYNDTGVGFRTCFVEFNHTEPIVPKKYCLMTGNQTKQHPGRLPKSWTLKGKLNSTDEWTTITTVEDDEHLLPINNYTVEFSLEENHQAFQYFRFEVHEVQGHEPGSNEFWDNYVMELNELYFKGYKASDVQNDLSFATISGVEPRYVYTGSNINVAYTVTDVNGTALTEGTEYLGAIEPMPIMAAGDYRLTISAKEGSGFTGNQSLSFKVTDYPDNIEIDEDYQSPDLLGYYYVNMPGTGTKTVDLGHPEGFHKSIKIYDDGGKSGKYSDWCDGKLLLQAPEGYVMQLNGTVTSETGNDYLTVYDGSDTDANILGQEKFGNEDGEDIGNLTTSGQYLLLYFSSSSSSTRSGMNLTLSMISTTEAHSISFEYNAGGSATASPNPAPVGSIVTLTPSPNPGYLVYDFIVKDTYDHDVDVKASWYDNGSFTMPGSEVTVTPLTTHRLSFLGGLFVNMEWNETKTVDIPQGVSSFKVYDNGGKDGDYHGPCNDMLILNAPEGYVLRIEGKGDYNNIGVPQSFNVFDGTTLMHNYTGGHHVNIGPLTTNSNQMQLLFSNMDDGGYGLDLTVTVYKPNCWGDGTDGTMEHPYEISNIDGLELLATLSESNTFEGQYFKLTNDIATEGRPIRKMIGDNVEYPFCGHLDGDGHTITVALSNGNAFTGEDEAEGGLALFHYVGNGCELKNLTVAGTINTANKFAAGFIAYVKPGDAENIKSYTLDNCRSSVQVTSTHVGDNTIGGFIGLTKEYTHPVLSNCVFDGSFTSVEGTRFSGMVGYLSGHTTIDFVNNVVATDPSGLRIQNGEHYTFYRAHDNGCATTFTGNYYHTAIGTEQGTKAYRLNLPYGITTLRDNATAIGNSTSALYADGFNVDEQPYYTSYTSGPTVTLGPKTNFVIHSATVNYDDNSWPANPNGDGTFWFNMPAADATVTASMDLLFTVEGYGEGDGNWVFLATPTIEDITPSLDNHFIVVPESDYDLYRFNQSAELEWENFKLHYNDGTFRTLTNGRGYLYARKETYTLTFSSPFNWGVSQEIDLDYDPNADAKGWNLVGNPFPVKAYADRPYFKMNANGDDFEAVIDYTSTPIEACTGIMVQADGEGEKVTFSSIQKVHGQTDNNGYLVVEVAEPAEQGGASTGSGTLIDKAVVSFNEGEHLRKYFFNDAVTKLYITQDGTDYAIAYSEQQSEIMLNFKAVKDGAYTLSILPKYVDLSYLHLIDNKTGADIDLLATLEYSFNATTTDNESRFRLVFSAHDVPENTEIVAPTFAYYADGEIRLFEETEGNATLQVIDMMGRVIVSRSGNIQRLSTAGMTTGVYVLRLIQGEKVRTQKMVIQ